MSPVSSPTRAGGLGCATAEGSLIVLVSAKQRFVVGMWLLLACTCFSVLGRALWSQIDSHHTREIHSSIGWGCPQSTAAECRPPTESVTTPNRILALSLFVVAGTAGMLGLFLIMSQPRPTDTGRDRGCELVRAPTPTLPLGSGQRASDRRFCACRAGRRSIRVNERKRRWRSIYPGSAIRRRPGLG